MIMMMFTYINYNIAMCYKIYLHTEPARMAKVRNEINQKDIFMTRHMMMFSYLESTTGSGL
jgi:hypothetical protein